MSTEHHYATCHLSTMWRVAAYLLCVSALIGPRVVHCAAQDYLLPGDVRPLHYDLNLVYDIDPATKFSFFGLVDILITAKKPTSSIVLHSENFTVDKEKVKVVGDEPVPVSSVKLNDTYSFLTIELMGKLEEGKNYTLTIPFYGYLKNGLDGVYISQYIDKKTKTKQYLVTTQFEAISARKGFPCFDEPSYKATYSINLGHHRAYSAVSNMPLKETSKQNTLETYWPWNEVSSKFNNKSLSTFKFDQFEKSVPMSTYLIAFVISKFYYKESPHELSSTTFRIWARSDAIDQTEYASIIGPKVLTHYEKWFNVSFPLPKQDMIAIPDFSAGAMENWGLITYRETALLYDKDQSSFLNKERVAEVIAHELAHQWFGNLVTMKWWNDLWLNEGFATFVASVGVAAVEPTWRAEQGYAIDNIIAVLNLDALESSHPVSIPLENPKQISEIFDEISYRKGSTLIRMMTMFLGEDVFRKAINKYLVKYSYQNAEQDDLLSELTATNQEYGGLTRNVTVKEIMDTWTTQTGYPLLTVNRDYSDNSVTVLQKRYLALGAKAQTTASWWVPLNVLCENEVGQDSTEPLQWLAAHEGVENEHRFEHGSGNDEWILFNKDYLALYRVNYDKRNWQLLSSALNSDRYTSIPILSRVQLIEDSMALAYSNVLDYNTALELVGYIQRESEFQPIDTGLRALGKIENVLKRTPDYGAYQKFVRKLITNTYKRSGGLYTKSILNGDDLNSVKMQVTLSSWACRMKVPGCEESAMELFQQWMDTENPDENNPIPLDLRRTVYCVAISRGSVAHWRFVLARKQNANVAAAQQALQSALACTREVWILAQYLEWTVTEGSEVRSQDAPSVITSVAHSTVGYYVAKEFIYNRIEDLANMFRGQLSRVGRVVKSLVDQFTTQRELDEFLVWKEKNAKHLEDAQLSINQAVEKAKVNIAWLEKNRKTVVEKFREISSYHRSTRVPLWRMQQDFLPSIYAIHNISGARLHMFKYMFKVKNGGKT